MLGIRLVLHDKTGKYQGVARVLRYEGHMLVYDPQTNGAGWVAMRGIPSSLTEVESQSASDLGNFYPIPCTAPAGLAPHGEPWLEHTQTRAQSSKPPVRDFDIDWDTDDAQDRSRTPSLVTIIDEPTQGAMEGTPTTWHNRCLVPERILEASVELHREDMPEKKEKEEKETPKDENTLSGERSTPVAKDDVIILHVGVKDL